MKMLALQLLWKKMCPSDEAHMFIIARLLHTERFGFRYMLAATETTVKTASEIQKGQQQKQHRKQAAT